MIYSCLISMMMLAELLLPNDARCCCFRSTYLSFALYFAKEADDPFFRVGYNSLGAFATINHLHFQPHGISFEKKLMMLFGAHQSEERSNGKNQGGPTQRASPLAALNAAFSLSPVPKPTSATRPAGIDQASLPVVLL